jgi:bifunctional DNase/RNase
VFKPGHKIMVDVTLRDVFHHQERGESWLVLADETGRKGLPIFVGSWDTKFITMGLRKGTPRPMTFHFFANVLTAIGTELVEVQVTEIVDNTFRAVACIQAGGVRKEVDARPSDAVALATVMDRPIRVNEKVMAAFGVPLGADGMPPNLGEGFLSTRALWSESPAASAP